MKLTDVLAPECATAVKYLGNTEPFHMWSKIVGQVSKIKGSGILKLVWCKANKDFQFIFFLRISLGKKVEKC